MPPPPPPSTYLPCWLLLPRPTRTAHLSRSAAPLDPSPHPSTRTPPPSRLVMPGSSQPETYTDFAGRTWSTKQMAYSYPQTEDECKFVFDPKKPTR